MSDLKNFDDYIKEELGSYSPDVPSHIWEKIIAERESRKPKAFWWLQNKKLFLLAGILLLGGTAVWWVSNQFSDQKIPVKTATTSSIPKGNQNTNIVTPADNSDLNTEPGESQPKQNDAGIVTPDKNNTASTASDMPGNNIADNIGTSNTNTTKTDMPANDRGQPVISGKKKIHVNVSASEQVIGEDIPAIDDYYNSLSQGGTLMSRLLFNVKNITGRSAQEMELQRSPLNPIHLPDCPTVEKDAAGNKKYFEVYAGPDFTLRSFNDTPNSAYLEKRKASTKVISAYSAGIRYTRVFKNGMSLRAGINYSQVNERFSFIQNNLVQVTYIIDPVTGDTTGTYTVRGSRYKTTYNHYRTVDIPLLLGYELGYGRFHVNLNAGAIVNLYSWQRGEILDTTYQPVDITTGKGPSSYQYKTNVGLGFTAAASLYYKLTDRLQILAEPYFRYNFSTMSRDNLTLKQKYNALGLRFGIRLDLQ